MRPLAPGILVAFSALTACHQPVGVKLQEDTACDFTWHLDADGDGFGDPDNSIQACEPPDGYVEDATDCDDSDPTVFPGALEICNGVDDDCDGLVDNDAIDASQWFPDADGDGYGADDGVVESCDPPEGYVATGGDCDDGDPAINPGAEEIWYDGVDQDCDGADDYDADGDGHRAEPWGGDCDDHDPEVHPDATEWPNDGKDNNCDGVSLEGAAIFVQEGEVATGDVTLTVGLVADAAIILDTTGSVGSAASSLDLDTILDAVPERIADMQIGLAHYEDYAYGSYGSSSSGDLPFELLMQVTDDVSLIRAALSAMPTGYGADHPESTMEALWQAATGDGYDMGCDGSYDADEDVLPFMAHPDDPFGGGAGETWDPSVTGGGVRGGMGFRDDATPLLIYATDAAFRDPDEGYGTPGGCPFDAGSSDVVAAVEDLGAFVLGVMATSTSSTIDQAEDLASDTDSYGDTDGDGEADDLLVATVSLSSSGIAGGLGEIIAAWAPRYLEDVEVVLEGDDLELVTAVSPSSFAELDLDTDSPVTVSITLSGDVDAGPYGLVLPVTARLETGDRYRLTSETVYLCVTPAE